jgi:hypothetical protein
VEILARNLELSEEISMDNLQLSAGDLNAQSRSSAGPWRKSKESNGDLNAQHIELKKESHNVQSLDAGYSVLLWMMKNFRKKLRTFENN